MYNFYKKEDNIQAAKSYGDPYLSEPEVVKLTKALVKIIMQGLDEDPNTGLKWVISILNLENTEFEIQSRLCQNFNYYLLPMVMEQTDIHTKLTLINNISEASKILIDFNPDAATNLKSMAVLYLKAGDLYLSYGDLQMAKTKFNDGLQIFEKLLKGELGSESLLNYLSRSYQRIAQLDIRFGDPVMALKNCKKAFYTLKDKNKYEQEEITTIKQIADTCYKLFKFYYSRSNISDQIKYKQLLVQIVNHIQNYGIELEPKFQELLSSF